MPHPLIDQFRFTRSEWLRGLEGVSEQDAVRQFGPMNCISWIVGHMAWHEQRYWLDLAQGKVPLLQLNAICAYGAPKSTPPFSIMLDCWHLITALADPFLDSLSTERLQSGLSDRSRPKGQTVGSALRRITYHYWYHIGEVQALRQMLNHGDLPQYVGRIEAEAPYRPE